MKIDIPDSVLIDMDYLESLVGTADVKGHELLKDIGITFNEEIVLFKKNILESIERNDIEELKRYAHKISGGASSVGLRRLAEYSKSVENALKAGETLDLKAVESDMISLVEETTLAFNELIA